MISQGAMPFLDQVPPAKRNDGYTPPFCMLEKQRACLHQDLIRIIIMTKSIDDVE
jgi:hypothetical protein